MIDEEITYTEKGYRSTDLASKSHKEVWRICDGCGEGRWMELRYYRDLCRNCANHAEERNKKIGDANRRRVITEETRIKLRARKNGMSGRCHNSEAREKMRRNSNVPRGKDHPWYGADISGEKNPNWKGGTSFEPYCHKFNNAFKEEVRERFGRLCFMCLMTEEKNIKKLCVHHVSYDKECMCNGVDCEFVPLCKNCHSKTNGSRDLWERLIINVLYYEEWI